jgi:hypothetical protein
MVDISVPTSLQASLSPLQAREFVRLYLGDLVDEEQVDEEE